MFVGDDISWCNMHTVFAKKADGGLLQQQLNHPSGKSPEELRAAELACLTHNLRLSSKRAFFRLEFMRGSPRGSLNVLCIHSEPFISPSFLRGLSAGLAEITRLQLLPAAALKPADLFVPLVFGQSSEGRLNPLLRKKFVLELGHSPLVLFDLVCLLGYMNIVSQILLFCWCVLREKKPSPSSSRHVAYSEP